jgi:hypothetical protein
MSSELRRSVPRSLAPFQAFCDQSGSGDITLTPMASPPVLKRAQSTPSIDALDAMSFIFSLLLRFFSFYDVALRKNQLNIRVP